MTENKKQVNYTDLYIPKRTVRSFETFQDLKNTFGIPQTLGTSAENINNLNMVFDDIGGFNAIAMSLQQHASDMGQYPLTSFIGYGALQQIAQNGMIRACIQTVADDMTRNWIEISQSENEQFKNIDFNYICENKYKLRSLFNRVFSTVGYMGGCFVYIDTGAENEDLTLPLAINNNSAELQKGNKLRFVLVDPVNVSPCEYNCINPLKTDYMQPKFWYVLGKRVHHTRLLSFIENEPPLLLKPNYNFLGIPQAQILWDYVLHWNECRVYTAKLLRKISLLVVKTDTDAVLASADGVANLDAKMDLLARYRDNDSVFVCDKDGEDVSNVQTSITGCTDIVRQCLEMICAINRTPAVKTLGISPSGFNATGESDIKNYYDHIKAMQELHHDNIQKIIKCIELVTIGEIDKSITFEFKPLDEEHQEFKSTNFKY